jgi:hypothetical protein
MAKLTERKSMVPDDAKPNATAMMIHPAESLEDGGSHDDLADVAAHEVHLAHHHGDDLDRGDRQRRSEEKRCDEARLRAWQDRIRQHFAERETADERQHHPGGGNRDRRPPDPPHQPQIGLHAGQQQQHQDAELRNRVEHAVLRGRVRKKRVLQVGPDQAEHGGTEQQPAEQLSHDRRLAYSLHQFAETAADQQQDAKVSEKKRNFPSAANAIETAPSRNTAAITPRDTIAARPRCRRLLDSWAVACVRRSTPRMVRRFPFCGRYAFSVGLAVNSASVGQRSWVSGTIMRIEKPSRV